MVVAARSSGTGAGQSPQRRFASASKPAGSRANAFADDSSTGNESCHIIAPGGGVDASEREVSSFESLARHPSPSGDAVNGMAYTRVSPSTT